MEYTTRAGPAATMRDFQQIEWDADLIDDCRQLIRLAIREDLGRQHDWTTVALVDPEREGAAALVARQAGVIAGLPVGELVLAEAGGTIQWHAIFQDGDPCDRGTELAVMSGKVRELLTLERIVLNFLGRLCGIATLTRQFVDATAGTKARIYDTRKTTPGWRRLEKYAVRCGGGTNHRLGLYDHILIKDNHLAFLREQVAAAGDDTNEIAGLAVRRARAFLQEQCGDAKWKATIVEIEVDTLEQLQQALAERPDVVLLDNMLPEQLQRAVALRDSVAPETELEASGGIRLETLPAIAASGVERVSAGALTHAAVSLDIGLDWRE